MRTQHGTPPNRGEEGSYTSHAINLQVKARDAHRDWLANLSQEERAHIKSLGLDTPPDDDSEVGGHSPFSLNDIADTSHARCEVDFAAAIDKPHEELADRFGLSAASAKELLEWHNHETDIAVRKHQANFLQLIVGGLLASKNPKLNAAGLAFAAGLAALNGLPCQREYARQNHISPSAVSKVVKGWQRTLGIHPSAHQKSEEACNTYAIVGKANHWRGQRFCAASNLLKRLKPTSDPTLN